MSDDGKPLAVLVTGTRHGLYPDWAPVIEARFRLIGPIDALIHGDAPGIDTIAARVADDELGVPRIAAFPAKWHREGDAAGPIRNKKMLEKLLALRIKEGYRIRVEGFHHDYPNSSGTRNMAEMAVQLSLDLADRFPVCLTTGTGSTVDLVDLRQTLKRQYRDSQRRMEDLFR